MDGGIRARLTVSEERFARVLLGIMALGFAALIAAAIAIGWINVRNDRYTDAVLHTLEVRQAVSDLQVAVEQSETARRGYLLTGDRQFRDTHDRVSAALLPQVARLRAMTSDNPAQGQRLARVAPALDALTLLRRDSIALVDAGRLAAAQRAFGADATVTMTRAIRARLRAMAAAEDHLLAQRSAQQQAATRWFYAMLLVAGVLLAAVATASLLVVRHTTAAIAASRAKLRSLNENLELIVAERTSDLTRANDEIQRFAYIVSHDLRSPLVNVMGFTAELEASAGHIRALIDRAEADAPGVVDEEARIAAREDLPEAIGFIRTSTQRMDRLINAILVLSRQGRRVLAPEPLDLAAIVAGIRDTLAHRLDEQGASVEVAGILPAIVSDRLAIEQILSNLIENAVKYRHADRPVRVTVSGGREGPRAWIEVADNGRGIDARDHERVFDLFRRSGTQDQPGEGIGLAHVRALAYRLGGTIGLRSTLGEGAAFRVSLPLTLEPQEKSA